MLSDVNMFFAEQDEIMDRPSESLSEYLARRRKSGNANHSCSFPEELSPVLPRISFSEIEQTLLRIRPETSPSEQLSNTQGQSKHPVPSAENERGAIDQIAVKRRSDHMPPDHGRERPRKKQKPSDDTDTPQVGSSVAHVCNSTKAFLLSQVVPPGRKGSSDSTSHEQQTAEATLADQSLVPSASSFPNLPETRAASVEDVEALRSTVDRKASARTSALLDTSIVTTPPNTAPPVQSKITDAARPRAVGKQTKAGRSTAATKKQPKGKPPRYTPLEYAKIVQDKFADEAKRVRFKPLLKGKRIYFYGGDLNIAGESTRGKMEKIVKHGGELMAVFDPDVTTHIVTDADQKPFLSNIGYKKLSDIPNHIPTLKWNWIADSLGDSAYVKEGRPCKNIDNVSLRKYAKYPERSDAGMGNVPGPRIESATTSNKALHAAAGNGKQKEDVGQYDDSEDFSHISEFTLDAIKAPGGGAKPLPSSPPSSPMLSGLYAGNAAPSTSTSGAFRREGLTASTSVDPFAEFYTEVIAERDVEMFGDADGKKNKGLLLSDTAVDSLGLKVDRKGFLCDEKYSRTKRGACPNQDVVDILGQLRVLYHLKPMPGNVHRGYGLNKAIGSLRRLPTRVKSTEEALKLRGVGIATAQKIMEIINTGKLERIRHMNTEDVRVIKTFVGIYGVGLNIAQMWYQNGCRTLQDLLTRRGDLNIANAQLIGIRYYDDINKRIPRAEVQEIYDLIRAEALRLDPKLFVQVMGSFRRGKADCGDIDVLITRPTDDGKTHRGILKTLLDVLQLKGIITEHLSLPSNFNDLELVYHGLCRRDGHSLRRRIDFLTIPWATKGGALLYYTGDDIFNRSMRYKARMMGYSLNQRGLYRDVIRNPSNPKQKLHEGTLVASETEEEIFRILGVPWQEPHERVRG